jgi:hypothetical protein
MVLVYTSSVCSRSHSVKWRIWPCRPLLLSPSPATSVLKREADLAFGSIGARLLPRTGTIVNLLDLTAIAFPVGFRKTRSLWGFVDRSRLCRARAARFDSTPLRIAPVAISGSGRACDAHRRTADYFELDNTSPVQVCVSSGTDTPGWGNRGCPAYRRGPAREGQAEVRGPVIESRSTIRHAVDRAPLQCRHRRRSPQSGVPEAPRL